MTTEERLHRLTGIVEALASSVAARDRRIEQVLMMSEENARNWEQLRREWQAYLRTFPRP